MTTQATAQLATVQKSKVEIELERIEQQKTKLLDGLKMELAKVLSVASDKLKLLQRLGVKNPLLEPQFAEHCDVLGISAQAELHFPGGADEKKTNKRKPRGSYPEATIESVTAIVKAGGDKGVKAGKLSEHFGLGQWNKKKKELAKAFTIDKDGVSRIWHVK